MRAKDKRDSEATTPIKFSQEKYYRDSFTTTQKKSCFLNLFGCYYVEEVSGDRIFSSSTFLVTGLQNLRNLTSCQWMIHRLQVGYVTCQLWNPFLETLETGLRS